MNYRKPAPVAAAAAAFFFLFALPIGAQSSIPVQARRVVLGGRAVAMVADAIYAFPAARQSVVAIAGTDQGLGAFLEAVDPGFLAKPTLDRTAGAEAYAALRPDLVIVKSAMKASLGVGLAALAIPALYLNLESPEDYYAELAILGSVFGSQARAAELSRYYQDIVGRTEAAAAAAASAGLAAPRVLVMQAGAGSYQVPPDSWMQTRLVELAGGKAVWKGANPGNGWATVGPEQILAWNPDLVVLISYKEDSKALAEAFKADKRFASMTALRNGAVLGYAQDFYSWDQPDTRWGLGLLWLSKSLYPAQSASLSIESEARRFFKLFYELDDARFDAVIKPRLAGDWR
jgi:iron complex transport system substrate-binding protein